MFRTVRMSPRQRRLLALLSPAVVAAAVVVACTPSIGDKCTISTDCSQLGDKLCDSTQPGGYCTVFGCEPDSCLNAICVAFNTSIDPACSNTNSGQYPRLEETFCMAPCNDTGDCRDEYQCVNLSDPLQQTAWRAEVVDLGAGDGGLGYSVCMAATCADGKQDAAETDVDCGGSVCAACPDKKKCNSGNDCISSTCVLGICVDPSCTDGMRSDVGKTDVDCGGPNCAPCHSGQGCALGSDCASGLCGINSGASGLCDPGDCSDGVKDGAETDVDCGGGGCAPCAVAKGCGGDSDCISQTCRSNICVAAATPAVCLVPDAGELTDGAPWDASDNGWTGPDGG